MGFLVYLLPWFVQRHWKSAVGFGLLGAVLVWLERWLLAPADTFWGLALGLAVNAFLSTLPGLLLAVARKNLGGRPGLILSGLKVGIAVLIPLALWVTTGALFRAQDYYQMGHVKVAQSGAEALSEADIHAIVVVPEETARNKARQVVGQYGSQFRVGNFYLQRYQGQLIWAAALEPDSWLTQLNAGTSPGYVIVSATDETAPARLVTGYKMKYTQDGFFGQWLPRAIRSKYPDAVFSEFSFELDEQGRPYWVGSAAHYEIGLNAARVDSVILVDPETGDSQRVPLSEMPDWVDQAVPEHLAADYAHWWGQYELGFWNAQFTQRGVKKLTNVSSEGRSMVGVNGTTGHFYYFSGMTSSNSKDTSLIGYMLVDARTGEMIFHQVPGISSEENIGRVVENEFKAQKYVAGYPLPYNIYGRFTWVVPVLDSHENGQLMAVALVSEDATTVASGKNLTDALRLYKARMSGKKGAGPTDTATLLKLSGTVDRIAQATDQGTSVYYMVLVEKPGKVFTAPLGLSPHLTVTKPGDKVVLEYAETNEVLVPVTGFHNLELER
jgi:hypothetical protein